MKEKGVKVKYQMMPAAEIAAEISVKIRAQVEKFAMRKFTSGVRERIEQIATEVIAGYKLPNVKLGVVRKKEEVIYVSFGSSWWRSQVAVPMKVVEEGKGL